MRSFVLSHPRILGVVLVALCFGVRGATPDGGTLSLQTQQLNYGGGPFDFENGTDQLGDGSTLQCSALSPCDDYALSVVLPADFGAAYPGASIRVELVTDASSDYDLYVRDDGGDYVAIAWNEGSSEVVEFPAGSGNQTFTVRAVPFAGGGAYTATVSLVGGPPASDADGDGVPDSADFCPDTPPGTEVKPNGCPVETIDTDGDGISDEDDLCPGTPAGTPVDANGCTAGLPEVELHFHGNTHDSGGAAATTCTGVGQVDAAPTGCGGPFLLPSDALDSAAAAHFEDNGVLVTTNGTGAADPNWQWFPQEAATLSGRILIRAWGSCSSGCVALGAVWDLSLWKNGTQVAMFNDVSANPELGDVPSLLTFSLNLADTITLAPGDQLSLVIKGGYTVDNANTRIYYDSTQACGPGATGPCDSLVVFNARDTDGDGVPDLLDQCQGTPPGAEVDATGCPATAACAAAGAAAAQSGIPVSGTLTIDAAVNAEWAKLAPTATYGAFVHFFRQGTRAQQDAVLRSVGLATLHDFRRYGTFVFAQGPVAAFKALAGNPLVMRIEHNRPLRYHDATQSWAMRARMAQERVGGGPYYDANGDVLTGKGVTLGIIDSGMFGAHPDYGGLDRIVHNYKLVSPVGGPVYYQDVGIGDSENGGGGHGTHVSGIVAGGGQQSNGGYPDPAVAPFIEGTFTSASPESKIIHWGNGAVIFVLSVELAYQHLLDNIGLPEFATLRAVNNSYGDNGDAVPTPYNPNDSDKQLIKQIVGCGVNMVFSAGNAGGTGTGGDGVADQTSSTCKDPTPGVICVASYNDQGTGTINGPLSGFSSRGQLGKPHEYPDIAAPGDLSTSTCAQATPTQAICTGGDDAEAETEWQPWYGTISGTSMASPNVVSVIGMLAQANPSLTPAQIEQLLQRTARKIGSGYEPDPQHPGSTIHFGYGAGLVDVKAALDDMAVAQEGLPPVGEPWTIFAADADPSLAGAADIVSLVMQEYTDAGGVHGAEYRLAVRDIAAFGGSSEIAYRIAQNVNGRHYETTVLATSAGVTIPEPGAGNTAPATSAGRIGDAFVIRVPYTALGYPPVEAPIHNIVAFASDGSGTLDYAPSPPGSTGAQAPFQPMHGRPFTVRQAVPLPEDTESVCVVPGKTRLIDDPGDQVQTPPGFEEQYDLLSVQVAEPGDGPLANKVVVTMKMRGFPGGVVPSGTRWAIRFNGPKAPPAGQDDFFIMMTTEEGAAPTFRYGTTGVTTDPSGTAGARTFQIVGALDPASQFFEDGRIQLVLTRDNALIGPLQPGDTLVKMFPAIRAPATPNNNAIYDQGGEFEHTLTDPATCLNLLPVAALSANVTLGDPPLMVTFDGSASVDPDAGGEIASYTFDFGDGSAPVTQAEPTAQHTYTEGGVFVASLVVQDKDGAVSTNPAEVEIRIEAPPVADAGADATAIEGTLHALDGRGSADPNGDALSFAWQQLSGPAVTLTGANTATPGFTAPEVCADDQLVFLLTVTDGTGRSSVDEVSVLIDNLNAAPVANAGADFSVKERGTVLLSAAASTDQDCEGLSYAWTQTAGPTAGLQGADTAMASFTAPAVDQPTVLTFRLTVEDPAGESSFDDITVTVEDDPVIGDNGVGGLSWLTLVGLGLGGWLRRRRLNP